jgi:hypothetical protein
VGGLTRCCGVVVLWEGGNSGALVLVCSVRRSAYALMELQEVLAGVFST